MIQMFGCRTKYRYANLSALGFLSSCWHGLAAPFERWNPVTVLIEIKNLHSRDEKGAIGQVDDSFQVDPAHAAKESHGNWAHALCCSGRYSEFDDSATLSDAIRINTSVCQAFIRGHARNERADNGYVLTLGNLLQLADQSPRVEKSFGVLDRSSGEKIHAEAIAPAIEPEGGTRANWQLLREDEP